MENFDVQLQEWNQDVPPEEEEFPINFPNLFDPRVPQQHIPNPPLPPLPSRSPSPLPDFNISNPGRPTLPLNLPNPAHSHSSFFPPRLPSPEFNFPIWNLPSPPLPPRTPPSPEVPGQGQGLDEDGSENEPFFNIEGNRKYNLKFIYYNCRVNNNICKAWEPDRPTTQHQEITA